MNDITTATQKTRMIPEEKSPETGELPLQRKTNRRYKFIRSIGFGGMKAVLLVFDTDTAREVAMAMMPDFRERPQADLERFVHEARITARLEHPNIIPVYDMGLDENGAPFFTMKYLRGESLAQYLLRVRAGEADAVNTYSLNRMLQIFIRVCNAIRFAHSRNVLHLDIKPNNISLGDFGAVSVLDWGLAAEMVTEPSGRRHLTGNVTRGTPGFMSPEQIRGGMHLDERADIYSLGALLYTILTGSNPMSGKPPEEILRLAINNQVPLPSQEAPDREIPAALEAIVMKAMAYRPGDRYASVAELRQDVASFMDGFAPQAEHATVIRRMALFINRNFIVSLLLAVIALLTGTLIFVLF